MTVINHNYVHKVIKNRLNSRNACSIQHRILCIFISYQKTYNSLREEHELTVFESSMLMSVCGPKGEEIAGGRRKLLNKKLHNSYSLNITRVLNSRSMMRAGQ
jgi:hypothetical protein